MSRAPNGRFAVGNPGGPGRPKQVDRQDYDRIEKMILRIIHKAVKSNLPFSDDERTEIVDLVTTIALHSPNPTATIRAARIVLDMEDANIRNGVYAE